MQEDQAKRVALPAGKGGKKEAKVEAWSSLDGLWEAVRAGPRLRAQQPAVLAHALRVLLAMWQVQPCASPCLFCLLSLCFCASSFATPLELAYHKHWGRQH